MSVVRISGVLGGYHHGDTSMSEKMAPPKFRVRLICGSKHITLGVKQKEIKGYSPCQSVLASYGKLLAPNSSENVAPIIILHT